jgi:Leucine-rich repeat (LRR) protein
MMMFICACQVFLLEKDATTIGVDQVPQEVDKNQPLDDELSRTIPAGYTKRENMSSRDKESHKGVVTTGAAATVCRDDMDMRADGDVLPQRVPDTLAPSIVLMPTGLPKPEPLPMPEPLQDSDPPPSSTEADLEGQVADNEIDSALAPPPPSLQRARNVEARPLRPGAYDETFADGTVQWNRNNSFYKGGIHVLGREGAPHPVRDDTIRIGGLSEHSPRSNRDNSTASPRGLETETAPEFTHPGRENSGVQEERNPPPTNTTSEEVPSKQRKVVLGGVALVVVAVLLAVIIPVLVISGEKEDSPNADTIDENIPVEYLVDVDPSRIPNLPEYSLTALEDEATPQFRAYQWLVQDPKFENYTDAKKTQRFAMACLYFSMGGPNWNRKDPQATNWLNYDQDECDWIPGQEICNTDDGSIRLLNISRLSGFGGAIPPELPLLLTKLETLDFSNSILQGSLWDILPWRVYGNHSDILFTSLKRLWCRNCRLEGSLPAEIATGLPNLRSLHLEGNSISGKLPSEIARMTTLKYLHLAENVLTGSLPSEMGLMNLEILALSANRISQTIPSSIGALTTLREFWMFQNSLAGSLPTELGLLKNLTFLKLDQNSLTGSIPTEVGLLIKLKELHLSYNELTGSIPTELGLSALKRLNLEGNLGLFQVVPEEICNGTTNLILSTDWCKGYDKCCPDT